MTTDTATILGDLLRSALDDCRVKLPALAERRVVDRMVELAEIAGVEIAIAPTFSTRENQPEGEITMPTTTSSSRKCETVEE